jgi:SAM-dependent methyltransferase
MGKLQTKRVTRTREDTTVPENLVKSKARVRDLGEVFTPAWMVSDMLDQFPAEMWEVHPSPTYLEPSCGTGNFLVAILARKLARVRASGLTTDTYAIWPYILEAVSSIYGVDISKENVKEARANMEDVVREWCADIPGIDLDDSSNLSALRFILRRNIQVGDMLSADRDDMPLISYGWDDPESFRVSITCTTFGAVMAEAKTGTDMQVTTTRNYKLSALDKVTTNLPKKRITR